MNFGLSVTNYLVSQVKLTIAIIAIITVIRRVMIFTLKDVLFVAVLTQVAAIRAAAQVGAVKSSFPALASVC